MVAEEDVIALVVERHGSSALELRLVVENRAEHPADLMTQSSGKVREHHLGPVRCEVAKLSFDIGRELHVADLEVRRRSVG